MTRIGRRATTTLLLLWIAGSAGGTPQPPEPFAPHFGKERPALPRVIDETGDRGFDCLDLRLELVLDFDEETIQGIARHRIRATAPLDTLELDLTDSLDVHAVLRDLGITESIHAAEKLRVPLTPPLMPGEETEITIHYGGHPPREGLLGFSFETRDGAPAAYTLSEPSGASSWWPCKDLPNDKLTATVAFDIPDTLYAGSNGLLVEDHITEGRRRMEWRESWPIAPYLISVACTNYAVFEDLYTGIDGRDLPLLYLAYPEDAGEAHVSWGRTPAMISAFENRFSAYPFYGEKYGMAEFSWGGAMEHQTLSSIGAYAIDGTDSNDWLFAHELAHQWWGDWITPSDWDQIWLNEGFARYSEAIWFESIGGIEGYRDWIRRMWRPSFPGRIVPPDYLFNSTVYLKGAWVLHMLRGVLGEQTFFAALDLYTARHSHGIAETEDWIDACEDAAGRDLRWFFDPWVYGTGRPGYLATWEVVPDERELEIDLTIEQLQPEPPFQMPIEVEIEDAEGSYLLLVTDSLRVQTFRLPVRLPPVAVGLDPNDWILKDWIGGSAVEEAGIDRPAVGIPYPSPGAPPFSISVSHSEPGGRIELFDTTGRRLNEILLSGGRDVRWDGRDRRGRDLPSGLYFLRFTSPGRAETRRIWMLR